MRPSWVEIDLAAVRNNVAALAGLVTPAQVCAVVKADGYGHGDVPVAEAALSAGATWLAVALVEEGVRLREAGIAAPILLLSEPDMADTSEVVHWGLIPTVYQRSFIEALDKTAPHGIALHFKVDTGMHRVGAPPEAVAEMVELILSSRRLELGGLWTHFASSEEDPAFTSEQVARFDRATDGVAVGWRHMANTAGAILYPEARADLVRLGIGIYGIHPSPLTRPHVSLQPAMKMVSQVGYVQRLPAGSRPSYGRRRPLEKEATVVTVPIGYADGVPRLLSERGGEVLIGGKRHPLAGTITMDQLMVEVGDDPVQPGDEVVLVGRQGEEEILADEWAEKVNTIAYEVVCQVGPRLPRRYLA